MVLRLVVPVELAIAIAIVVVAALDGTQMMMTRALSREAVGDDHP